MTRQPQQPDPSVPEARDNYHATRAALEQEVIELYQSMAGSLLRYALLVAGNYSAAQDAVQETFLRYYVCRTKGDPRPASRGWFFRVVRNYILDQHKSASARSSVSLSHAVAYPDNRYSPEEAFERSEALKRAFSQLSPRELECLRLRGEGFSYKEIAEILGIESGTVGALLARGLKKIQELSAQEENICETS